MKMIRTIMTREPLSALVTAFLTMATLSFGPTITAQETIKTSSDIGTVEFGVSCSEPASAEFDHALTLLHHMMYAQARAKFEQITESHPACAMAYWGVAMTLFQPLWPTRPDEQTLERGLRLIEKARELGPATEREGLLIEAAAGVFRDPRSADYQERMQRWAEGMATAYRAAPEDHDTAALYALSRLTVAQQAEDRNPLHDEAEQILRKVWEQEPKHPGAVHYTIHSTDIDGRGENALDIVETYGEVAPEVPHALHMPSHIYVRLGDWPSVVEWNKRSAKAALANPAGDAISHHYLHAMDYLTYAYLQQGRNDKARQTVKEALSREPHQGTSISAFHAAAMPARLAVERREWSEAVELTPRTPDYLPWDQAQWPEGHVWYARGLGAVHIDNHELATRAEERLRELRDEARAAGEEGFAKNIEIDRRILDGWLAHSRGETDEALQLVRSAAKLEDEIEKDPTTPGALLPPNEALGDLLMDLDRPDEALAAYRASDVIWPGRFNTLLGAARAANAAGNERAARDYYGRLVEVAGTSGRQGVIEAREYLGRRVSLKM